MSNQNSDHSDAYFWRTYEEDAAWGEVMNEVTREMTYGDADAMRQLPVMVSFINAPTIGEAIHCARQALMLYKEGHHHTS
jgi:hypothetical protein